jgi:hypothetical protein
VSRRQFQLIWTLLVLVTLAVAVGGVAIGASLHETGKRERQDRIVQQQRQDDMCAVVRLVDPTDAPTPAPSSRASVVANGLNAYLARNCPGR